MQDDIPNPDPLLNAKQGAAHVNLSTPAFWRNVSEGWLPKPYYPAPRAPRWRRSELDEAVKATRRMPAEALAERRARRLAKGSARRRRTPAPDNRPAA